MARFSVLLADDHPQIRNRVTEMLSTHYDIVASVGDGASAVAAAAALHPDVAVLDISMPTLNGLDAAAQIVEQQPAVRVVFLTVFEDQEIVQAARSLGAHAYVLKRAIGIDLLPAIEGVLAGRSAFPDCAAVETHAAQHC